MITFFQHNFCKFFSKQSNVQKSKNNTKYMSKLELVKYQEVVKLTTIDLLSA